MTSVPTVESTKLLSAQPIAEAEELKRIETLWIDRLMSQHPLGLNRITHDPNRRDANKE